MSFHSLRSRFGSHKKDIEQSSSLTSSGPEGATSNPTFTDQSYDGDKERSRSSSYYDDNMSVASFRDIDEKQVFEDQLNHLQEQLVAVMIENQKQAQELKEYQEMAAGDKVRLELEKEKHRRKQLEQELKEKNKKLKRRELNKPDKKVAVSLPDYTDEFEIVEGADVGEPVCPEPLEEDQGVSKKSRFDKIWDRVIDIMYDTFDDFAEQTVDVDQPVIVEPLNMKTLKENIRRFKVAAQPYYDTIKGLHNLFTWKSKSHTFIVFFIYMYSVWHGWLMPLLFFMAALRIFVNFLHFKNFQFRFAYLNVGETSQEEDKDLGLSDKFNLVIQVATKVQNGLGTAADSLEKIKNLLTWKHREGAKRLFTMLCYGFLFTSIFPGSFVWRFVGLGMGVKIFIINYIYNKYPRLKKKYDNTHRLWLTLPTDVQYDKKFVRDEVDKYIVPNQRSSEGDTDSLAETTTMELDSSDEEEASNFRELFSLPVEESPLQGWLSGKRSVLLGKEKSLISLLSKKRGKLYLTRSFLCFVREKVPSQKNIVVPLQDIVSIQKVKPLQKLPGKGMAVQLHVIHQGRENILVFGAIVGRDEVVKSISAAVEQARQGRQPESIRVPREMSHRKSTDSLSKIQNFTFAAYYEDSE